MNQERKQENFKICGIKIIKKSKEKIAEWDTQQPCRKAENVYRTHVDYSENIMESARSLTDSINFYFNALTSSRNSVHSSSKK